MPTLIGAYQDDALITQLGTSNPIAMTAIFANLSTGETEQIFIGYPTAGLQFRRKTLPGTNQLQFGIVDLLALNGGTVMAPDDSFRFALTEAGLAAAVWGDWLDLGVEILSGVSNALPVWIECRDQAGAVGLSKNLMFVILDVEDVPV